MEKQNSLKASKKAGLFESDLKSLASIAKKASIIGGEVLNTNFGRIKRIENKGRVGDLVTNADIEAEKEIINYLKGQTPEFSILAEESGKDSKKNPLSWCIDPLDGTTNFAHGYPFFATSIGLTWKNVPILGAIDIPFLKENYTGGPTIGSFCNSVPIKVSSCSSLRDSLLVTGFAYDRLITLENNYAEFCWLTHRTRGVRRGGAAAVDLAFVACGRLDGYWERGLSPWDLAAGVAIVENAGGEISDYPRNEFELNSGRVLACSPGLHNSLKEELGKVMPLPSKSYGAQEHKDIRS